MRNFAVLPSSSSTFSSCARRTVASIVRSSSHVRSPLLSFASPSAISCNNNNSFSFAAAGPAALVSASRAISSFGRITDEDRRWWLIHLECCPDVTSGTFVSWLDNCGTHTTKKLIERNIWTVEQVAGLSSDQVDELRYKEGCIHMDVVWEHARTVLVPLKARTAGMSAEASTLHDRILELRKKRELEKRRQEILQERKDTVESREESLRALREAVEKKRAALRQRMQDKQREQQEQRGNNNDDEGDGDSSSSSDASKIVDNMSSGGGGASAGR